MLKNLREALKRCIIKQAKDGGWYTFDVVLSEYKNALIEALREAPKEDISRIERRLNEFYNFCHGKRG